MLSRVQSLEQLFILNDVPSNKLYANAKALLEVESLESRSINKNPTTWNISSESITKVAFLNIQSIQNKIDWIQSDRSLQQSTAMFISETWLDESDTDISLPGYHASVNSVGRGHGTAAFYRGDYTLQQDIHIERINITK